VVDEAKAAGIEHFIFVTGRNKTVIEDHFDKQVELESTLKERGKFEQLKMLNDLLPEAGQTSYTRQQSPLGLGHAVWCARDLVGDEPFALLLPDVLVQAPEKGCLSQMMDIYNDTGGNVLAVEEVAPEDTSSYGVVSLGEDKGTTLTINGMVEKPDPGKAPSNLIIMGRYILQPEVFDILATQTQGAGNEIQITDAMQTLMEKQEFYACQYEGRSFDCGSKVGFLAANVAFALEREDIGPSFKDAIKKLVD
jgi:UTP--glucose-1-phosphate uridylyltransferase